jgi:malate dehydrogenase (oxaloacetate-decarboxylating)(NADP+)
LRVVSSQGVTVGPILLGAAKPVHILMPVTTVRGLVNMTALTAVEAGVRTEPPKQPVSGLRTISSVQAA